MSNLILTSSTAVGVAVVGVVGIIRSDGGLKKLNITIGLAVLDSTVLIHVQGALPEDNAF